MLILGDQHLPKKESLEVEFKEFCIHDCEISNNNIYEIVKHGKIKNKKDFNQEIYKNINRYFYKYIPKYTSAFINACINGDLIIGVNDFGEISGIPFIGTKHELQSYIDKISIKHFLRGSSHYDIKYNVEQLKIDNNYIDDISEKLLKEYYFNIKQRELIIQKFKNDRIKWIDKMHEYTCKLPLLLSSKKKEFDEYLTSNAPQHLNYVIKQHEMRNISHLKNDSTHYIYWLMQFKDLNLRILKTQKPQIAELPKIKNSPIYLFKHLTNLRYHLVNNNKNLNYYIVNINIINYSSLSDVFYYDIDKKIWLKKTRRLHKDGPKCLDD